MKKKLQFEIMILLVLTILPVSTLLTGCRKTDLNLQPTPLSHSNQEDVQFSLLFPNENINSGITIERATPALSSQVNNITFTVFNHTEEPITFPNQGFGLKIFAYQKTERLWAQVKLPQVPYEMPVILPAKIEKWSLAGPYMWSIPENETEALGQKKIRIYVSGSGNLTSTIYGAYLDILISQAH